MLVSSQCYEVPGVKILTYNGPIYYGNRSFFREEMSRLLGLTPEKIRSWEKARKALEKREREATINTVVRLLQSLNELRQKNTVYRFLKFTYTVKSNLISMSYFPSSIVL